MNAFDFLEDYVTELPEQERNDPDVGYMLRSGKSEAEIRRLELEAGFLVPDELREFYRFSYGALLDEYKILGESQHIVDTF